jgi:hypothetical protein
VCREYPASLEHLALRGSQPGADHSNRRGTPKDYAVWEPVMKVEVIE